MSESGEILPNLTSRGAEGREEREVSQEGVGFSAIAGERRQGSDLLHEITLHTSRSDYERIQTKFLKLCECGGVHVEEVD